MERYMVGTKIARPWDGQMERYMVGTKIALQIKAVTSCSTRKIDQQGTDG